MDEDGFVVPDYMWIKKIWVNRFGLYDSPVEESWKSRKVFLDFAAFFICIKLKPKEI